MPNSLFIANKNLKLLFDSLSNLGYQTIGPKVQENTIKYLPINSAEQLPWGISDEQDAGTYNLINDNPKRAFNFNTGAYALKNYVFPAEETLWQVKRDNDGKGSLEFISQDSQQKLAILGVRSCDINALDLLDRHFLSNKKHKQVDPWYQNRRQNLLLIAVNCNKSSNSCFCSSAGTGPEVKSGFDLLIDEIDEGFLLSSGSASGEQILAQITATSVSEQQRKTAEQRLQSAKQQQSRTIPSNNLATKIANNLTSDIWQQVAEKCLACGNCTLVCPSCFCHKHEDTPELDLSASSHIRLWESCFSDNHSMMHGHSQRATIANRYRQWLSHKFSSWHQQYDSSGCTGCGRCITWCPVGIDISQVLHQIDKESKNVTT